MRRRSARRDCAESKTRNRVLGARVNLYMAAKKWDMVAAVASHLVKVYPKAAGWWISLAYALRRTESVEKAESHSAYLNSIEGQRTRVLHPPARPNFKLETKSPK